GGGLGRVRVDAVARGEVEGVVAGGIRSGRARERPGRGVEGDPTGQGVAAVLGQQRRREAARGDVEDARGPDHEAGARVGGDRGRLVHREGEVLDEVDADAVVGDDV